MLCRTIATASRSGRYFYQPVRILHNKMAETRTELVDVDGQPPLKKIKLDTPEFHSLFTPELDRLAELFKNYNHELRIAGGAVRDLLMGKKPQDLDFATTARPDEMKTMFDKEGVRMINAKGEKHGTITPRIHDKENFEVTTLRIDKVTDGRHAEVEFTKDWRIDAERRDLTINSMFLDLDGTVYDYFNGKEDLDKRIVQFVGSPIARIQEDYLRILRYFRFYGRIAESADSHCSKTLEAIKANAEGLSGISGERIWMELQKIVTGNHAGSLMKYMYDQGIPQYMGLPEYGDVKEFQAVFKRSQALSPKPVTLVSALLKDEGDVINFDKRLKVSAEERKVGFFIVGHRNQVEIIEDRLKPYKDMLVMGLFKDKDTITKVTELLKYKGEAAMLEELQNWEIPKFPVSGNDLIKIGVKPSKKFGKQIDKLREVWKNSNFTATKEELLDHAEDFKAGTSKDT
ncbi:CCA tRNA nucleotidyltransferase 1, mitochondrial-like [Glandiceps talaboti]